MIIKEYLKIVLLSKSHKLYMDNIRKVNILLCLQTWGSFIVYKSMQSIKPRTIEVINFVESITPLLLFKSRRKSIIVRLYSFGTCHY